MEDLKQYKKVWQEQTHTNNQISANTLTKMIHKKSSSIVKWIFYVSVIEFVVLTLVNIFVKTDWDELKEMGLYHLLIGISILGYVITLFFIYLFYKNYKSISITDTTKDLIKNILNTRRTVKYYILTNITIIAVTLLYSTYVILQAPEYENIAENYGSNGMLVIWGIIIVFILISLGLFFLIYMLLYGFLLRNLNTNYKELLKEE